MGPGLHPAGRARALTVAGVNRHAVSVTFPAPAPTVETIVDPTSMLAADVVQAIYGTAAAGPPLFEDAGVAARFAGLYAQARYWPGAVQVVARLAGEPVGFGYGHTWAWAAPADPWSLLLAERLGTAAAVLESSFALQLLAVLPRAQGLGLGRLLLDRLLAATSHRTVWLQTTDLESPALALYRSVGFVPLGHGPDAPDGRPGLVLVRGDLTHLG